MEDTKGFGKAAGFAPHKTIRHTIPSVRHPDVWQFGVHDHHSEGGAGRHFDLRLGHPATGHAHSWAMRHWPGPGETRLAVQQPTHTVKYMDFQGRIESGYGKGRVDLARRGRIEVQSSSNDHVRFRTLDRDPEQYFLRRTDGNKWILKNVTDKTKTAALFHGSPRKLDTLQPQSEHGDPRVGSVVFASPSRPFALAYAGGKWGDRDIEQGVRGGSRPRVLLREMRPGALQQVYDRPGYLYTLPEDSFQDAHRRTRLELTSPQAVRPIRSERIDNVMGALRASPAVELHPYDPNHPATRAAVIRQVKRMKEMRPDEAADYRKWRMAVAPPEIRRMVREEEKRAYARAREATAGEKVAELYRYAGWKQAELESGEAVREKTAATIQQLEQGVARLPGVVLSQHPVVQAFGAMVAPTKRQLKGRGSKIMMGMQRKLMGPEAFDSIQAAAKDLEHPSLRGKILHSGDVGTYLHPAAPPQVRKDLGTAALMHEALERKGTLGQGLHTLGTELTDFNLVSRLRGGPREDAVRQSMLELRAPEHQHLRGQFVQRFADPRAAEFVADGSRIPKAMRKAYAREMRPHTHTTIPEASGVMQEQGQVMGGRHFAAQLQNAPTVKLGELAEDGEHQLQGHIDFQGLDIAVENRKGSVRSGKKPDGGTWRTVMKAPYGYIEAPAKGRDGESIDAYVGPVKDAPVAYVVHQHEPDGIGHDEDKVMLGVRSEQEAKRLYLQHYDDPKFLGPIDAVPIERLRELVAKRRKINKLAGVAAGPMALKAMKPPFKPLGPAANVTSLTQKWKPPKAQAPSVPSLPGTPKF